MDGWLLFLVLTLTVFIIFVILYLKKNSKIGEVDNDISISGLDARFSNYQSNIKNKITKASETTLLPIEQIPTNIEINESSLYEIKDSNLLFKLSLLSPVIVNVLGKTQTITSTVTSRIEGDAYRVILKNGGDLVKVKGSSDDLRRAFTMGSKGISENAVLQKTNPKVTTQIDQTTAITTSAAANIMNVASLVVGQYYMSQVNSKIENIERSISNISNFQKNEFKSKIRSLVANVGNISIFMEEIFEDETIRNNKLIHLQSLNDQATQLLEHVNLSIDDCIQTKSKKDYDSYINDVNEMDNLIFFQETLLKILKEIGRLTFIFGKGQISQENSLTLFQLYQEKSQTLREKLTTWHTDQVNKQKMFLKDYKVRKKGLKGYLTNVTGLIQDEWRYSKIDETIVTKISQQLQPMNIEKSEYDLNLYDEETQILIKNGKTYLWLPDDNENLIS